MIDLLLDLFWVIVAVLLSVTYPAPFNLIMAFAGGAILCGALRDYYRLGAGNDY